MGGMAVRVVAGIAGGIMSIRIMAVISMTIPFAMAAVSIAITTVTATVRAMAIAAAVSSGVCPFTATAAPMAGSVTAVTMTVTTAITSTTSSPSAATATIGEQGGRTRPRPLLTRHRARHDTEGKKENSPEEEKCCFIHTWWLGWSIKTICCIPHTWQNPGCHR